MSSLCVVSCDQRVVKQRIFLNKNEIVYDKRLQCISLALYVLLCNIKIRCFLTNFMRG